MIARPYLLAVPLVVAACSPSGDEAPSAPQPTASGGATVSATAASGGEPGQAMSLKKRDDLINFEFAYPAQAAAIPTLALRLDRNATTAEEELRERAREGKAAAEDSGFPFNLYSFAREWKVVADLPRFLSLSSSTSTYTGGAHGNYGYGSLVWDREGDKAMKPLEFFASAAALENAVGTPFCEALNRQQAKKRGEAVPVDSDDSFEACPSLTDLTVLLGSSSGKKFDRIGLIADPYVAGPWVEGSYEVTVPVTVQVLDAVKPEYTEFFSIGS